MALPTKPEGAYKAAPDKITSAVKRFDMRPPLFYSTMNKSKTKAITWEDIRVGLSQLTKFTIDGRTLGDVVAAFEPRGLGKRCLLMKNISIILKTYLYRNYPSKLHQPKNTRISLIIKRATSLKWIRIA
jgi:hypothetical protein